MKSNFVIITSIFNPTEAVQLFARLNDWQLVVVGDSKTPKGWHYPGVVYLSPEDQLNMKSTLIDELPWNTYARKMAGYIYAIRNGAKLIADTDDDNIPCNDWGQNIVFSNHFETIQHDGFINIYKYFTNEPVWPRGFPLNHILNKVLSNPRSSATEDSEIGIWQFLADEDPDVDAIYRLINNTPIIFNKRSPLILSSGTICPFNSQNTFFRKETFPLLYLPVHVNFRFTDILRGLVAQPILWAASYSLCFGHATAIQRRNPHDYLLDFESEIPCYLYPEKIIELVCHDVSAKNSIPENMMSAYEALLKKKIVVKDELKLLKAWLSQF